MAIRAKIDCINKSDRSNIHERITHVGGPNYGDKRWKLEQKTAIAGIEDGTYEFYVNEGGKSVEVIVSTSPSGNKYLKTANDGTDENNLLSLPECK